MFYIRPISSLSAPTSAISYTLHWLVAVTHRRFCSLFSAAKISRFLHFSPILVYLARIGTFFAQFPPPKNNRLAPKLPTKRYATDFRDWSYRVTVIPRISQSIDHPNFTNYKLTAESAQFAAASQDLFSSLPSLSNLTGSRSSCDPPSHRPAATCWDGY